LKAPAARNCDETEEIRGRDEAGADLAGGLKSIRFWQPHLRLLPQEAFLLQLKPYPAHEIGHGFSITIRQTLEGLVKRKHFDARPEDRVVNVNDVTRRPKNQFSSEQILPERVPGSGAPHV
jgi:hypothetical protein